jgi:cytochrome b involved in lipid metabolism
MSENDSNTVNLKVFSKESLIEHAKSNPNNTFISIHENVYDVTSFLDEHPGGEEALKEHNIKNEFKDATESFEDTGHSMDARDMMKKYRIGSMEYKNEKKTVKPPLLKPAGHNEESSNYFTWAILGTIVVALAIGYQYILAKSS